MKTLKTILICLNLLSLNAFSQSWNPDEELVTIPNAGIYLNSHEITVLRQLIRFQEPELNLTREEPLQAKISTDAVSIAQNWAKTLLYTPIIGTYNPEHTLNNAPHPSNVWYFSYSQEEWEEMKSGKAIFPVLPDHDLSLGIKAYRSLDVKSGAISFFGAIAWESNSTVESGKIISLQGQRIDQLNLYEWLDKCGDFCISHYDTETGLHHLPSFGAVLHLGASFYYHDKLGLIQITGHDEDRYLTTIVMGFETLEEIGISSTTADYHTQNSFQVVTLEGIKSVWVSGANFEGSPEILSLIEENNSGDDKVSLGYVSGTLDSKTAAKRGLWVYNRVYGDLWLHDSFYPYVYSQPNQYDIHDLETVSGMELGGGDTLRWRDVSRVASPANYNDNQKSLIQNESLNFWGESASVTLPIQPISPSISFDKEYADPYEPVHVSWFAPGESPLIEVDGQSYNDIATTKLIYLTTPGTHTAMLTIGNKVYRDTIHINDYKTKYGIEQLEVDSEPGESPCIIWKTTNTPIVRIEGWRHHDYYSSNYTRLSLGFKIPGEKKITVRDGDEDSIYVIEPGNEVPDPKQLEF